MSSNKIYEIENVLNGFEVKNAYKQLLSNNWSIDSSFGDETFSNLYPTFRVSFEDSIYQPYWFGYFSGIVSSINSHLRKEKNFDLGSYSIKSIVLNQCTSELIILFVALIARYIPVQRLAASGSDFSTICSA